MLEVRTQSISLLSPEHPIDRTVLSKVQYVSAHEANRIQIALQMS